MASPFGARRSTIKTAQKPSPATEADLEGQVLERRCRVALVGVVLVMFTTVCFLSLKPVTWPASYFNDMAILMAGENYAKHGFIKLHLLPVYFIGDLSDEAGYYTYYSHTPPLFHLFNGLLQTAGIHSLAVMRIICGCLFIVGVVCMYSAFAPAIGPLAAVCGVGFIGTTGWFISYGVGLYDTLNFFFLGVFFLFFMRAVHRDGPAGRLWLVCWFLLMLASMNSYEFILYAQVFAWAYAWAAGRLRAAWRPLLLLALAPVVSIGLHFLQVVWALGWTAAWADRLGFSYVRGGIDGLSARWDYMKRLPGFLIDMSQQVFFWPFHVFVLAGVLWLIGVSRKRDNDDRALTSGPLLWALLLASPTWFLAMPYAAVRNIYTVQQLVPLVVAVMGIVTAVVGRALFAGHTPPVVRYLAALAGIMLLFGQGYSMWDNAQGHKDQLAILAEAIGPDALPPRVGVLTNDGTIPVAYFIRRPWWRVPNMEPVPPIPFPETLGMLQKHIPPDWPIRYYLYASWGDPGPFQLLATTCPGRVLKLSGGQNFLVLFDISNLHLPPDKRPPLDPQVREGQLRGEFPEWQIPGLGERVARLTQGR